MFITINEFSIIFCKLNEVNMFVYCIQLRKYKGFNSDFETFCEFILNCMIYVWR